MSRLIPAHLSLLLLPLLCTCADGDRMNAPSPAKEYAGWAHYGGNPELNHYSSSTLIDTNNVGDLGIAWTYHTGDADLEKNSQIQCNPLIVNGVLYGTSPEMRLFALDARTGEHHWTFDPNDPALNTKGPVVRHGMINSRGLAHWTDGEEMRLFFAAGSGMFAIDAATGKPIPSFGTGGTIDLHDHLGRDVSRNFVAATSPGVVFKDLLIIGARVDENLPAAPGHIRAYNVRTGELAWIFHTIPQPGEDGYETWDNPDAWEYTGGANAWSGFSLDEERGIVYCGTGSASYDFYGGNRPGDNLYANCILALDAATGKRKWHYQTIHHDLWDKDHPTPPMLVTVKHDGQRVDAVAQATKNGQLFLLDRESGEPLFPIEEVPVPDVEGLPGEAYSPTQPVPTRPRPFSRQTVGRDDINPHLSAADRSVVESIYAESETGSPFLPPRLGKNILFPGFDGGAEWGGPAFNPETGLLFVNASNMAWVVEMLENQWKAPGPETWARAGHRLYNLHCRSCHGTDRAGTGNNPSLVNIGDRYDTPAFTTLVRQGRRMMPAFAHLQEEEVAAIGAFVLEQEVAGQQSFSVVAKSPEEDPTYLPYKMKGYEKFLAPDGKPAISPPWGTLTAIDLHTGEHRWQVPLGEYEDYRAAGIPPTGTESYGGPVVTAGGVLFIAGTADRMFRAYHQRTGELLWQTELPAAGFATPAVYEMEGRQYVVIACGGGKLGARSGDAYVAFALPGPADALTKK